MAWPKMQWTLSNKGFGYSIVNSGVTVSRQCSTSKDVLVIKYEQTKPSYLSHKIDVAKNKGS